MLRALLIVALSAPAVPAVAAPAPVRPTIQSGGDCQTKTGQKKKKSGFGKLLGNFAGDVVAKNARSLGVGYAGQRQLQQGVADSIACSLSPAEKKKAEEATMKAVTQPVGTTVSWQSDTRPDVKGASTVASQTTLADGTECKDVRKVATVDGEEQFIVERMCRAPGASGFVKQA